VTIVKNLEVNHCLHHMMVTAEPRRCSLSAPSGDIMVTSKIHLRASLNIFLLDQGIFDASNISILRKRVLTWSLSFSAFGNC
jgi:hypothetical protein